MSKTVVFYLYDILFLQGTFQAKCSLFVEFTAKNKATVIL